MATHWFFTEGDFVALKADAEGYPAVLAAEAWPLRAVRVTRVPEYLADITPHPQYFCLLRADDTYIERGPGDPMRVNGSWFEKV